MAAQFSALRLSFHCTESYADCTSFYHSFDAADGFSNSAAIGFANILPYCTAFFLSLKSPVSCPVGVAHPATYEYALSSAISKAHYSTFLSTVRSSLISTLQAALLTSFQPALQKTHPATYCQAYCISHKRANQPIRASEIL